MTRKHRDQYFTPKSLTLALLKNAKISGTVLEPCAGEGHISEVLHEYECDVTTNDIDSKFNTDYNMDITDGINGDKFWNTMKENHGYFNWIITNPPFSKAAEIMKQAYKLADNGVALMARLSLLEPCEGRDKFLVANPPDQIIILPRVSFTGDGHCDSVTCAWMIWYKDVRSNYAPISVYLREWL